MYVLTRLWPEPRLGLDHRILVGTIIALAGLMLGAISLLMFRRAGTTINPIAIDKATSLVRTGPFRFSRNPMYLGMAIILAGLAVAFGVWVGFLMLPIFVFYITTFQIKPEEEALRNKFGSEFEDYCSKVRRWI
jgi:protein-S-isoprenylcysteine O-methyltransferase Ste14